VLFRSEESRALGAWAGERGIDNLVGTIFCYPDSILAGDGTIVYSGPKALFEANETLLAGMGGKPQFLSEKIGAAPTYDKALYAFHYGSLICFLHGAAISHAAGIPISAYLEQALTVSSGTATKERMARMVETRSYETDAAAMRVDLAAYDHVLKLSEALGVESELPRLIADIMRRTCRLGYAEQDLAAAFEVLRDPEKGKEAGE
jgi:3-hydroxyisobutyrate dehydrogenase-like beta-hydroxyacid dehydrogenase